MKRITNFQKLSNALEYITMQAEEYNNSNHRETLSRLIARMTGAAHVLHCVGIQVCYYMTEHSQIVAIGITDGQHEGLVKTELGIKLTGTDTPEGLDNFQKWEVLY